MEPPEAPSLAIAATLLLGLAAFAGCASDGPGSQGPLEATGASTWGEACQESDRAGPEDEAGAECVEVDVVLTNENETEAMDVTRPNWAGTTASDALLQALDVIGATEVPPGEAVEMTVLFAVNEAATLAEVAYEDNWMDRPVNATVPAY